MVHTPVQYPYPWHFYQKNKPILIATGQRNNDAAGPNDVAKQDFGTLAFPIFHLYLFCKQNFMQPIESCKYFWALKKFQDL